MSLRDVGTNGRQGERISGMATDACLESECRAQTKRREREREREKGRRERYKRSFVSVAARTGNTRYGRHLVFSFGHE